MLVKILQKKNLNNNLTLFRMMQEQCNKPVAAKSAGFYLIFSLIHFYEFHCNPFSDLMCNPFLPKENFLFYHVQWFKVTKVKGNSCPQTPWKFH